LTYAVFTGGQKEVAREVRCFRCKTPVAALALS
jgi:hypothetical protein